MPSPHPVEAAGVRAGDVLAGKYRVDRVLGVGGMGVVVAARHLSLDERVAIKFLLPEAVGTPEAVARFVREARAAVRIKSEHVARVIDVGKLDSGAPYMVMEYLDGSDLAAWVAQRGKMAIEQAVEFLLQACEAIAEAHALGIVHRDLKPANLFVIRRPDGGLSIKVLDFGISKITTPGSPEMAMTRTSTIIGSPLYMSPEQMQSSRNVDARADVWSLGVILFELVTGRVPFEGEVLTELIAKILSTPPSPVRGFAPEVPPALEQVILRCLEKDRERRYATVGEFAAALAPFGPPRVAQSLERIHGVLEAAGIARRPSTPAVQPVAVQPTQSMTAASWGQTAGQPAASPRSRGGAIAAVAAVVVLAMAGGGGVLFYRGRAAAIGGASTATPPTTPEPATGSVPSAVSSSTSVTQESTIPTEPPTASAAPSAQVPSARPAVPAYPVAPPPARPAAAPPPLTRRRPTATRRTSSTPQGAASTDPNACEDPREDARTTRTARRDDGDRLRGRGRRQGSLHRRGVQGSGAARRPQAARGEGARSGPARI